MMTNLCSFYCRACWHSFPFGNENGEDKEFTHVRSKCVSQGHY